VRVSAARGVTPTVRIVLAAITCIGMVVAAAGCGSIGALAVRSPSRPLSSAAERRAYVASIVKSDAELLMDEVEIAMGGWIEPDSFYEMMDDTLEFETVGGNRLYERRARIDDTTVVVFKFISIDDVINRRQDRLLAAKHDAVVHHMDRRIEESKERKARAITNGWAPYQVTAGNTEIEPDFEMRKLERNDEIGERYRRLYKGMSLNEILVAESKWTSERWLKEGNMVRANQECERATRLAPDDPRTWYRLAEVQTAMGNRGGALASLAKVESLIPEPRNEDQVKLIAALRSKVSALP
jgi:tetratricopeptide (TPR) repeat protein